jgi:hypothetical protein
MIPAIFSRVYLVVKGDSVNRTAWSSGLAFSSVKKVCVQIFSIESQSSIRPS